MACKQEDSISLYFPNSGIHIAPMESNVRDKRRKYAVGEFRVPRTAGELVAERVPDGSPVDVQVGGITSRRMMYHGESLTFERTLDKTAVADIQLVDPVRIFERGTLTKRFSEVTLDTVVQYIMKQLRDEYNVIRGHAYTEGVDGFEERDSSSLYGRIHQAAEQSDIPYSDEIVNFFDSTNDKLEGFVYNETYSGFIFTDVSPLEALNEVANEFELDYWVDREGVLTLGLDGSVGQVVGVVDGTNALKLQRYAVTSNPNKINSVYVENGDLIMTPNLGRLNHPDHGGLRLMAEATDPTIPGDQLQAETEKGVNTLDDLEDIAERQLIRETMDQANGSMEINALASEDNETLAHLDIGDVISIGDQVNIACDKDLITGPFIVQGLDHKSNPRQGWSISLEVARIPNTHAIETRSFVYDPNQDKRYDDLEHFREENPDAGSDFGRAL